MTSFVFGAVTVLAVMGWGPRLHTFIDRQHRRWARRTKTRGTPLPATTEAFIDSYAPPIWHGADLLTQELPHIRPEAPLAERHWDTGDQPVVTIGARMGFAVDAEAS